ncbi:hypothetical protein IC582_004910 [Cucumis melo]|uniref:Uncharacterized protein n=1 Tax=Cucumis melo TaxID=3656 RepID=A0A9I9E7J5_CUCME
MPYRHLCLPCKTRVRRCESLVPKKPLTKEVEYLSSSSNERPKDPMVEGSGSKQESPNTSRKKKRNEPPKEDTAMNKKLKIKRLVSKRQFMRRKR